MFIIVEEYYEDGGYGDAVFTERPIGIVETEEEAKEYVNLYSCEHVYDIPYSDLRRGGLSYYKLPLLSIRGDLLNNIIKFEAYRGDIEDQINSFGDETYKDSLKLIESKLKELNNILKNEKEKEN